MSSMSWGGNVSRAPFWLISIVVVPGLPNISSISIYDDASAANKNLKPAKRSQGSGEAFVARNALILDMALISKKARALILGCLRTA